MNSAYFKFFLFICIAYCVTLMTLMFNEDFPTNNNSSDLSVLEFKIILNQLLVLLLNKRIKNLIIV